MSFTISCPSCQRTLHVPENLLGQMVKCPSCNQTFTAPDKAEEEAPPRRAEGPPPRLPATPASEHDYHEDDEARRRGRRRPEKPSKVQAIAIMILVGGILATLNGLGLLAYCGIIGVASGGFGFVCCLWPGSYFGLVLGIMGIIKGSRLLGEQAHNETPPKGIAVMMIVNIINGDIVNLTLGILVLVFLSDREVKDFFRSDVAASR